MTTRISICLLALLLLGCDQQTSDTNDVASPTDKQQSETAPIQAENSEFKEDSKVKNDQAAANAITEGAITQHVKTLASDEFGGRAPGTQGEELTVAYLIKEFKAAGLKPGNGDSFTQAVPLTSVAVTNQPTLTIDGGEGEAMELIYTKDQVVWSRQQTEQAAINNSELVFVGYGINAPEQDWNDYAEVDVTGKTVLMLVNDPGYATQDDSLFNGNSMTYYGRWDYKLDEAAKQGAAAAVIIHDTKPAAYPWSTVASSWTGPQFDMVRSDKGAELALIEGWITQQKAVELFNRVGMDLSDMYQAAKTRGFKAVELDLTATATINKKVDSLDSQNVVAMIEGSEAPDEVFIYMAHWDHIGTDPTLEGDNIFNGALDNATGTGGLIEIAKAYTSLPNKPKRSVVFIALTAEEQGLLGSAFYAANPIFPLAKTVGGLNMDGLNYFGPTNDLTVIGYGMSELESYLDKNAKAQGRVLKADPYPENGYYYRSDHFELAKFGVPMLYPSIGLDHKEKGEAFGRQKEDEYTANHYHGPSDEYDSSWDLSGAVEDLQLYFLTGKDVVNSTDWPNWNEGTEFKEIRDKQRNKQN